jgi:hypothetical protein
MMKQRIDRRRVLLSGAAAGIGFAAPFSGAVGRAATPNAAPLKVVITLNQKRFEFDEAKGRDLGDYAGPRFVQRCVLVMLPDLPLSVLMRPDRDSDRVEIVVELGRLWSGKPAHLGAYTADILRGDIQLVHVEVPEHYWFSRWRWQSSPRPLIAQPADLIREGLIPPYANIPGLARRHPKRPPKIYTPMGTAGINPYMPATGEGNDIGPVTEPQGMYLCLGDPQALQEVLYQAEASATVPWHMRDEKTGGLFDVKTYPHGGWYGREVDSPFIPTLRSKVVPDTAHQPSLSYLPFLLTGDPYFLEELQFQTMWGLGDNPPQYRRDDQCILGVGQTRALAWSLRNLVQLAKVTPDRVPAWLLPKGFWARVLENNRLWFDATFVRSTAPEQRIFRITKIGGNPQSRIVARGTYYPPWQQDFLAFIMGWVVMLGFESWRDAFVWTIGATIARTNGKSGWIRAYSTPYVLVIRPSPSDPVASSWAEAWALNVEKQGFKYSDPNAFFKPNSGFFEYTRGALALGVRLGVPEARECFAWADEQARVKGIYYKWMVKA